MLLEYSIISGYITIPKSIFIKEMLYKESKLRMLLDWKSSNGFEAKHPVIGESSSEGLVTIKFDNTTNVSTTESPGQIISYLKEKYGGSIKGKIGCRAIYTTFGNVFFFGIDLDPEDGSFNYI